MWLASMLPERSRRSKRRNAGDRSLPFTEKTVLCSGGVGCVCRVVWVEGSVRGRMRHRRRLPTSPGKLPLLVEMEGMFAVFRRHFRGRPTPPLRGTASVHTAGVATRRRSGKTCRLHVKL